MYIVESESALLDNSVYAYKESLFPVALNVQAHSAQCLKKEVSKQKHIQ